MTQYYIGVKQVQAWEQEKDGKPGYAVKYPDGYISWSPKEAFESAYLPMGENNDGTRITGNMIRGFGTEALTTRLGNHLVVMINHRNGFTIVEDSACVYDEELGTRLAAEKGAKRIWDHLGFVLAWARNGLEPLRKPEVAEPGHEPENAGPTEAASG